MTTSINRRDLVKQGAAVVIGAGLAGGTVETGAAGQRSREAFERVLVWEDALADAGMRGESWVKDTKQMYFCVQLAVWQAEAIGEVALLQSLRPVLAEADALHEGRSVTFQRWADQAWSLPDLAPLPAEPWA